MYLGLRWLGRFWVWFLFRRVVVQDAGHVPSVGPVLLCVNHPNNLIDSLLLGAVLRRPVHYLATVTLFRPPLLGALLRGAGAIPVVRRQEATNAAERNVAAFAAVRDVLEAGRVVAIYPEGTTHAETRVQRIRTGAARIALEHGPAELALVPVGLSFEARKSFRGRVLVRFGPPLPLTSLQARHRHDPSAAILTLTESIQAAMEAQVVHVERLDAGELVRVVETLYRDDLVRQIQAERGLSPEAVDPFRLSRTIADAVRHFQAADPDRVERLSHRITRYRERLAGLRVRDEAVRAHLPGGPSPRPGRVSGLALVGLPVCAYGAVVNAVPYLVPRWLARRGARKETSYATIRLLASMVAFPVAWGAETWLVWRLAGPLGAVGFLLSLPVTGLLAHRYLAGLGRFGARARFVLLALTRRRAASRLLAARAAILEELERAKAEYLRTSRPAAGPGATPSCPSPEVR